MVAMVTASSTIQTGVGDRIGDAFPVWFSVKSLAVVVSARGKCTGVRV